MKVCFLIIMIIAGAEATSLRGLASSRVNAKLASSCAERWGQCGGLEWSGPSCCTESHVVCTIVNDHYSQCQPGAAPDDGKAGEWEQCGGDGWSGPTQCSLASNVCQKKDEYYSQCVPRPEGACLDTCSALVDDYDLSAQFEVGFCENAIKENSALRCDSAWYQIGCKKSIAWHCPSGECSTCEGADEGTDGDGTAEEDDTSGGGDAEDDGSSEGDDETRPEGWPQFGWNGEVCSEVGVSACLCDPDSCMIWSDDPTGCCCPECNRKQ